MSTYINDYIVNYIFIADSRNQYCYPDSLNYEANEIYDTIKRSKNSIELELIKKEKIEKGYIYYKLSLNDIYFLINVSIDLFENLSYALIEEMENLVQNMSDLGNFSMERLEEIYTKYQSKRNFLNSNEEEIFRDNPIMLNNNIEYSEVNINL